MIFFITLVVFYIPIALLLLNPRWKKAAFYVHIAWSWAVRILIFVHIKRLDSNRLPNEPFIVVANHGSYLDIFLMYSLIPAHPFLFLGKAEILKYPLVKTLFKRLNIPVFRQDSRKAAQSLIRAKQALQEGWSLIIFPEGTIPDSGWPKMLPFKDGAFKLAKSAQVPIVPITFINNWKLFSDPETFDGPARPGISRIMIHPTVSKEEVANMTVTELSSFCYACIDKELD
jgi:1-acyl-sn-glycerol-3-phosphate acyltransferase